MAQTSKRQILTAALCAASLCSSAFAESRGAFKLLESVPFDAESQYGEVDSLVKFLPGSDGNPAGPIREAFEQDLVPGLAFKPFKEAEGDESGCRIDPASPAIGADVPLTYFGVPSPGTNPSLVGAVQLLTSGPPRSRGPYHHPSALPGRALRQ